MIRLNHLHDVIRATYWQSDGLHRNHRRRQPNHIQQLD